MHPWLQNSTETLQNPIYLLFHSWPHQPRLPSNVSQYIAATAPIKSFSRLSLFHSNSLLLGLFLLRNFWIPVPVVYEVNWSSRIQLVLHHVCQNQWHSCHVIFDFLLKRKFGIFTFMCILARIILLYCFLYQHRQSILALHSSGNMAPVKAINNRTSNDGAFAWNDQNCWVDQKLFIIETDNSMNI